MDTVTVSKDVVLLVMGTMGLLTMIAYFLPKGDDLFISLACFIGALGVVALIAGLGHGFYMGVT